MSENEARQGVRVETVRDRCLCDSRRNYFFFICFLLLFIVLLIASGKSAAIGVCLFGVYWVVCVPLFLLKKLRTYSFLSRDGLYIVRQGWAVRIPWKMIESVKPTHYVSNGVGPYIIRYHEGIVDSVTETSFILDPKRDYIFPYSKRAKKIFCRYAKII